MPLTDAEMAEAKAMGPANPSGGLSPAEMKEAMAMGPANATAPERPIGGLVSGIGEAAANLGSGMLAKPVSDVAGLASIPLAAAGAKIDPTAVKQKVQSGMTYEPRTTAGQMISEYNPLALIGKGVDWAANKLTGAIEPPAGAAGTGAEVQRGVARGAGEALRQAPGFLGVKGGKVLGERLPAKQAALDIEKGRNAPIDAVRDRAQDASRPREERYITPPEGGIKGAVSGLVGKTKTERRAASHNEQAATTRLAREVGAKDGTALSPSEFDSLKRDTGKKYDALAKAAGPKLEITNEFENALKGTRASMGERLAYDAATYDGLRPAMKLIDSYLKKIGAPEVAPPMKGGPGIMKTLGEVASTQPGPGISRTIEKAGLDAPHHFGIPESPYMPIPATRTASMSTAQTLKAIQDLRRYAKEDFAKQSGDMGRTRLGIANQLEELVDANLQKSGNRQALQDYREARTRFAKIYMLERVTNRTTGRVDMQKLARLSNTPEYKNVLTGEFKEAADFANTYWKAAQPGRGEAPPRLTVFDGLFAASAIMAGHPLAAAAEIGGRVGVPMLGERGMLQNRTPSYRASSIPPSALTVSGAVLPSQSEGP